MKNPNVSQTWQDVLTAYLPGDRREASELTVMRALYAREGSRLLSRDCAYAHFTASSIIVNVDRTRTLMAFHRIYRSWAWTGGHADGEQYPEAVARREAEEETGIRSLRLLRELPASIEILPVWAHVRRGVFVPSHLHLNVSYLYEADENLRLRVRPDENSAVKWLPCDGLRRFVTEPDMLPIYERLLARTNNL